MLLQSSWYENVHKIRAKISYLNYFCALVYADTKSSTSEHINNTMRCAAILLKFRFFPPSETLRTGHRFFSFTYKISLDSSNEICFFLNKLQLYYFIDCANDRANLLENVCKFVILYSFELWLKADLDEKKKDKQIFSNGYVLNCFKQIKSYLPSECLSDLKV